MSLQNSSQTYGGVAKTFHWLTALLILTAIPLGILANGAPYETAEALARKGWLFSMHKTVGVTVFFIAFLRIMWAVFQPKPGGLHPERKLETLLAETVHWLLYGSLVIVPLTGWLHHAATSGFAPIRWPFGQDLPFVPKSDRLAEITAGLHIVFERVLVASLLLHLAGAVKHHVIDRDATLRRMLPGTPALPELPPHRAMLLPPVAALGIWAVALGIGAQLNVFAHQGAETPQSTTLETVASEWEVTDGTLNLEITQFGSPVSGAFSDWTASISYAPGETDGSVGSVAVNIAIASVTLGSVTEEALKPAYFDLATHPTAIFSGEILRTNGAHVLDGELTLKGVSVALNLPFDLTIDGNKATASGAITLDRRDFGIGSDENNPGFEVQVRFDLTALRET